MWFNFKIFTCFFKIIISTQITIWLEQPRQNMYTVLEVDTNKWSNIRKTKNKILHKK